MLFTSPAFIFLFLPVLLALHAATPGRLRNALLLLASLLFYTSGEFAHLGVLAWVIALNWLGGLAMATPAKSARRAVLTAVVACDLGTLAAVKYASFLAANLVALGLDWPPVAALAQARMALPLGVSFYIFHALSYAIDVYRGVARPRRNPVDFALYISFFPQLIAGPIVRYHDIAPMLDRRSIGLDSFASGVERFVAGMGKKMLLANPAGLLADRVFGAGAHGLTPCAAWLGIFAYALQIYFDFSGYSDMAIGLARMFGFGFLENFNYPYISASITEFWRRWHISLSNWFRDYLYIPLGGNRKGPARTYANLVTVFLLCGLWHGAQWTFVLWGLAHGGFLVLERAFLLRALARAPRVFGHSYAMLVVLLAWVLFRANDLPGAWQIYRALLGFSDRTASAVGVRDVLDTQARVVLLAGLVGATPLFACVTRDWRARLGQSRGEVGQAPPDGVARQAVRVVWLSGVLFLCLLSVAGTSYNPFIYFRF